MNSEGIDPFSPLMYEQQHQNTDDTPISIRSEQIAIPLLLLPQAPSFASSNQHQQHLLSLSPTGVNAIIMNNEKNSFDKPDNNEVEDDLNNRLLINGGNDSDQELLTPALIFNKQTIEQIHQVLDSDHTGVIIGDDTELQNQSTLRGYIPPPLPILPKQIPDYEAPKCPLEHISFIQLKKFQSFHNQPPEIMGTDFDKNQTTVKRKKPDTIDHDIGESSPHVLNNGNVSLPFQLGQGAVSVVQQQSSISPISPQKNQGAVTNNNFEQASMQDDQIPTFVNNIVFCRDPKALNKLEDSTRGMSTPGYFNLRHLIQHENYLDVKALIKNTTMASEIEKNESSLRMKRKNTRVGAPGAFKIGNDTEGLINQLTDGSAERTLVFESRFESGNLFLAQKSSDSEYNLLMQNDINTQGHTQWFYFRVQNTRRGLSVKFNIVNYSKPDSLYNYGMKVSIYSERKAQEQSIAWHRGCSNITYFSNSIRKEPLYMNKSYYTLTFTHDFEYNDDTVYFAYSIPYTYTDLLDDLMSIDVDPIKSQYASRKTLCKTLAGNNCDYLTVTSREKKDNASQRKCVVISARVHPGETVGSWMMRGVMKFITDPISQEARILRENFIFKIIPMLNPDGVINGNYRCSLAGCDLNRRWKTPSKIIHPTVYYTKKLIKESHEERGVLLFCDLHGHSRKQNIFMYGCHNQKDPEETRIFPYLLSKVSQFFSYDSSRFGNQKSKESTARISLYKDLKNVQNIFTMESTFSGMDYGPGKGMHLSTDDLETMGKDLMRTLLVYSEIYIPEDIPSIHQLLQSTHQYFSGSKHISDIDRKKFKEDQDFGGYGGPLKQAAAEELKSNGNLMRNCGDSSSGSESAPSDDNLQPEEIIKIIPVIDKKTKKDLENKKLKQQQYQQQLIQQQKEKQLLLQQQQQAVKKQIKKTQSRQNLQESKKKNERSMVKFPIIDFDLRKMDQPKEESKDSPKKKPKPMMIDAWTQTERSDYAIIKSRLQNGGINTNQNQSLIKEPGLYQQLMHQQHQKQRLLDPSSSASSQQQQYSLRFKSQSKPGNQQLGSLTRTPGAINNTNSTPGGHMMPSIDNNSQFRVPTEFANFLSKQQSSVSQNQVGNKLETNSINTGGGNSSSVSKYNSQMSMFANSDVTIGNLRSPSNNNINTSGYSSNTQQQYRELSNRSNNLYSNFQAMPDILQTNNNQQPIYKTPGGPNSSSIISNTSNNSNILNGGLASIMESGKYNGAQQFQTPNVKRQLVVPQSNNNNSMFKNNKNTIEINNNQIIGGGSQSVIGAPSHSLSAEQNNIKKLITNVQSNFKTSVINNEANSRHGALNSVLGGGPADMSSPGRSSVIGGNNHTIQPPSHQQQMNFVAHNHQRNPIKSPHLNGFNSISNNNGGLSTSMTTNAGSSAVPGAQKPTPVTTIQQPELIFPVLKSKYQSVNSGNLSDIVTGGLGGAQPSHIIRAAANDSIAATLSQLLVDNSSLSKYGASLNSKRAISNHPQFVGNAAQNANGGGGSTTKRNSSQQRVTAQQQQPLPASQQSANNGVGVVVKNNISNNNGASSSSRRNSQKNSFL